jgi:hypothetical protein
MPETQLTSVTTSGSTNSEDSRRTRALIDRSVPLVDRLLRLTRIPGVRGVVNDLVGLIRSIRP